MAHVPLDHSSTSFASWLGLLNRGSLRALKPSVCKLVLTLVSCLRLPDGCGHSVYLLFSGLFTQVHLLVDGSVEGQCIIERPTERLTAFSLLNVFHWIRHTICICPYCLWSVQVFIDIVLLSNEILYGTVKSTFDRQLDPTSAERIIKW